MLFSTFVATGAFALVAVATPLSGSHRVHEKRSSGPNGWSVKGSLDGETILPMRIALAQNNLHKGAEWLHDVSHPESENYGKHWTAKQIAEAFAPSAETIDSVKAWLAAAGIGDSRMKHSQSMGFLEFNATVDEAEDLLKTKYNLYAHDKTGQPHIACEEYSIPSHLREHVDFVYPTVHFDAKILPVGASSNSPGSLDKRDKNIGLGAPGSPWLPKLGRKLSGKGEIIQQLEDCDDQIIPNCLRFLYNFPPNANANSKNSYGIVEYTPQAYIPSDLDMFFKNFSVHQVGNRPIFDSIDGGVDQQSQTGFGYNGESDLDLEYAMTLVHPQNVTLYQAGDTVEGASFNNFLDAIDGSYCTYDGGDNPNYDAVYPDPYPGGYTGPENCGGFAATKVISTSYAYDEQDLTPAYEMRQCNEYMKLGLMGVSILFSSGDYGVAGNGGSCISNNGTGAFNPSFPGTCPYITSVGATQVIPGTNVVQAKESGTEPEQACETVIYSGGGFSNVFGIPSYQQSAVQEYYANYAPPYTSATYNNSQTSRGLPDIAVNGANYVIAVNGAFALVYGTSAASPVLGSILTLINQHRLAKGKSSIGFINPVAYAHPEIFNDITQGSNPGCSTAGFSAVPGWDPVTGLGTPNFPKMLKVFSALK